MSFSSAWRVLCVCESGVCCVISGSWVCVCVCCVFLLMGSSSCSCFQKREDRGADFSPFQRMSVSASRARRSSLTQLFLWTGLNWIRTTLRLPPCSMLVSPACSSSRACVPRTVLHGLTTTTSLRLWPTNLSVSSVIATHRYTLIHSETHHTSHTPVHHQTVYLFCMTVSDQHVMLTCYFRIIYIKISFSVIFRITFYFIFSGFILIVGLLSFCINFCCFLILQVTFNFISV